MRILSGKSVCKGVAMGSVLVFKNTEVPVQRKKAEDPKQEISRVKKACLQSKEQLQKLQEKAEQAVGVESAAVFEVHRMLLEGENYLSFIYGRIETDKICAECAVSAAGDHFCKMFAGMEDDYMKARGEDIMDITNRILRNLDGREEVHMEGIEPAVIVAVDLSPSEAVQLNREKVLAIVTAHGSMHSHTAILTRMMNIPTLVGVPMNLDELENGMFAIVDGDQGKVIFEPSKEMCSQAEKEINAESQRRELLNEMKGKESVTLSGRTVQVCANVGSTGDLECALAHDADGIGLFRSEFLYIGKPDFPTEEEQFQVYRHAVQRMAGKKVIIRTLDIGGDKQADYFHLMPEANPAMGYRAIRICLKQQDIFKVQLRALLRAAVYGNLSVMYPMIIAVKEVETILEIVKEVQKELEEEGIPHRMPEQGIMIETPAAVMVSDELAELVDFFSIGTNDLTQYTLAIDRQNEYLNDFYDPHHKAILKMIRLTIENAHKAGKWVGLCGELGADLSLTETFIQMGIDELSVAPSMVLEVRKQIRESTERS